MNDNNAIKEVKIYSMATDPIYIGTGGYTIGRVDNTIVRDPTTKIPKIPGSSVAGTWRYYVALELISKIKDCQPDFNDIKKEDSKEGNEKISLSKKLLQYSWKNLTDKTKTNFNELQAWLKFNGNQIAKITCAGQDNVSTANTNSPDATDKDGKTGHCGHCIVCKAFGYSKSNKSWQGMLFFSDLNILFFPIYTRLGVKWISSERILNEVGLIKENQSNTEQIVYAQKKIEKGRQDGYINLGWLNLPYKVKALPVDLSKVKVDDFKLILEDIIIVPDSLISQIINSNLEVRTSVSIDPITGAAKEGALFTSEAIPRGTIFYGNIRIFDKKAFANNNYLSETDDIKQALCDSKHYYKTLGIGGMTTRGFGRMNIFLEEKDGTSEYEKNNSGGGNDGQQS